MAEIECTLVLLISFLSLHHILVEGRLDVRYKGLQAGGGESVGQLEPLQDGDSFDRSPQNSESDVQFDHFMPFTHYLSKRQAPSNSNTTFVDNHNYYTTQFHPPGAMADSLWVNLSEVTGVTEDLAHNISDLYRFFAVHDLMFDFPFYGHIVNSVAITTAGFIYVGTFLHQFIHLTQYIAPLQADFNPGLNETATVLVYSTENQFTIQWDNVHNHDHISNGTFTFQMTLFKDGTIHFVYREIPLLVSEISDENHPVEIGLTDSFYVDTPIIGSGGPGILRTIYEYHRISLAATDDLANSAYVITPLPNCIMASSCDECVSISESSPFLCGWCDSLNRCSDGIDRHRQEWFLSGCVFTNTQQCEGPTTTAASTTTTASTTTASTTTVSTTTASTTTVSTTTASTTTATSTSTSASPTTTETSTDATSLVVNPGNKSQQTGNGLLSTGIVVGIAIVCMVIALVLVITAMVIAVLIYGYRNPTSKVGQHMIKYRPKARTLNKVSASYNVKGGEAKLF